jgi:hypothetical protein
LNSIWSQKSGSQLNIVKIFDFSQSSITVEDHRVPELLVSRIEELH